MGFFLTDSCAAEPASGIALYPQKRLPAATDATLGRRSYSPGMGRWLSRDPKGFRGGLNVYGFVGNGPLSKYDILGRAISLPPPRPPPPPGGGSPPKRPPKAPEGKVFKGWKSECRCQDLNMAAVAALAKFKAKYGGLAVVTHSHTQLGWKVDTASGGCRCKCIGDAEAVGAYRGRLCFVEVTGHLYERPCRWYPEFERPLPEDEWPDHEIQWPDDL